MVRGRLMQFLRRACWGALSFLAMAAFAQAPAAPDLPSQPIAGRYIVVFKPSVSDPAGEAARLVAAAGPGAQLHHVYTTSIKGFAATLPEAAVQALRRNPNVEHVEQDQTVNLSQDDPTR